MEPPLEHLTALTNTCFFSAFLSGGGELNLFGADERGHDAHVWRQEELQTHDEDGEDGEGQQLEAVIHQLQRQELTHNYTSFLHGAAENGRKKGENGHRTPVWLEQNSSETSAERLIYI